MGKKYAVSIFPPSCEGHTKEQYRTGNSSPGEVRGPVAV